MAIVVDASVAVSWFLTDELSSNGRLTRLHVLDRGAVAPILFWYEVRNVLLVGERRGRLSALEYLAATEALASMRIELDDTLDGSTTADLARRYRLTFYDASYLELAKRRDLPLASMDRDLISAASVEGVRIFAPGGSVS